VRPRLPDRHTVRATADVLALPVLVWLMAVQTADAVRHSQWLIAAAVSVVGVMATAGAVVHLARLLAPRTEAATADAEERER
jgi:uncharacterized membrane protein